MQKPSQKRGRPLWTSTPAFQDHIILHGHHPDTPPLDACKGAWAVWHPWPNPPLPFIDIQPYGAADGPLKVVSPRRQPPVFVRAALEHLPGSRLKVHWTGYILRDTFMEKAIPWGGAMAVPAWRLSPIFSLWRSALRCDCGHPVSRRLSDGTWVCAWCAPL